MTYTMHAIGFESFTTTVAQSTYDAVDQWLSYLDGIDSVYGFNGRPDSIEVRVVRDDGSIKWHLVKIKYELSWDIC